MARRPAVLQTLHTAVEPLHQALGKLLCPSACKVASEKNAVFVALLTAVLRWPDHGQASCFVHGFPSMRGVLLKIFGRVGGDLQWLFSMVSGHALTRYQKGDCADIDPASRKVLFAFRHMITHASPRGVSLRATASFEDGQLRIGWIIFSPVQACPSGGTCVIPAAASQQIFVGETLALGLQMSGACLRGGMSWNRRTPPRAFRPRILEWLLQ